MDISMLDTALLIAILIVLIGILTALKSGFNEVIKGLETLADDHRSSRH
jgi:hypothetical protein